MIRMIAQLLDLRHNLFALPVVWCEKSNPPAQLTPEAVSVGASAFFFVAVRVGGQIALHESFECFEQSTTKLHL